MQPVPDSPVLDEDTGIKREVSHDCVPAKRQKADSDDRMFDPPADTERCLAIGVLHDGILDFTRGWDFALLRHRDAALKLVNKVEPKLILGDTACYAVGSVRSWRESGRHTGFLGQLYRGQVQQGRWFLHVHPESASVRATREVSEALLGLSASSIGGASHKHDCDMYSADGARKTDVKFMTNSDDIVDAIRSSPPSTCSGTSKSFKPLLLRNGGLLAVVREGLRREVDACIPGLRKIVNVGPSTTLSGTPPLGEDDCAWQAAWDDVTGQELDPVAVAMARTKEMDYVNKKGVWSVIPRHEALGRGLKIIPTRWIDVNKGDSAHPNYRSRLVAKEYNTGTQEGLFAATPPLEALRLLISHAATLKDGQSPDQVVMINDVARAFFEAPIRRTVCIELPPEAGRSSGEVGLLRLSLYGTRDAAANFQAEVRAFMLGAGFEQSAYSPSVYFHSKRIGAWR